MRVQLERVGKAERIHALPVVTLRFESGRVTFGFAETEQRPTVLGLLASGRMHPDEGQVLIDGEADAAALRRRVALVDAPDVSSPEPNVSVSGVVAEELMFAGHRATPLAARQWLEEHGLREAGRLPMSNLQPAQRVRVLCELAALRDDVEGIVLVAPDRHGGDPRVWWDLAAGFAERGYAVLVIAGEAARLVLNPVLAPTDAPAPPDVPATTPTARVGPGESQTGEGAP